MTPLGTWECRLRVGGEIRPRTLGKKPVLGLPTAVLFYAPVLGAQVEKGPLAIL